MASRLSEFLGRRVWEPLRLRRAEQAARRYTPEQAETVRGFSRAARLRLEAARDLRDDRGSVAALLLLRDALRLALFGREAADGESGVGGAPSSARLSGWLAEADPLAADRMPEDERRSLQLEAEHEIRQVLASYEARTVPELRLQRLVRATAVLAALAGAVFAAITAISLSRDAASSADADDQPQPAKNRPRRNR